MAADTSKYKMSQERYDEIKEELHYLETVREKEVSELIKEARSFGDLSENSEYDEAKTEQGKLYSKIAELKALIEKAEIIEKTEMDRGTVALSSRIRLLDLDENEELEYQIVGSQEANPMSGRISDESPIGRGLLGHKVGETVTIEAPAGEMKFTRAGALGDIADTARQAGVAAGGGPRPVQADALCEERMVERDKGGV